MANLFKKKQEQGSSEAAVSSIPVPPADSALVIDLPEGQKLVLGKMEEGTVIEVATWRGTGRPDSRTNRLMLGVSIGGTSTPEQSQSESVTTELTGIARYQAVVRSVIVRIVDQTKAKILSLRDAIVSKRQESRSEESLEISDFATSSNKRAAKSSNSLTDEFDIDNWLKSVRSNSRVQRLADQDSKGLHGSKGKPKRSSGARPEKSGPGRSGSAKASKNRGAKKRK